MKKCKHNFERLVWCDYLQDKCAETDVTKEWGCPKNIAYYDCMIKEYVKKCSECDKILWKDGSIR